MNYPDQIPPVETCSVTDIAEVPALIADRETPLLVKNAVAHWPMVQAGRAGHLGDYLADFDRQLPTVVFRGDAADQGRIFYNERFDGFNYQRSQAGMLDTLQALESEAGVDHTCYVGSSSVDHYFPGLKPYLPMGIDDKQPLVSLWFGNQTRVAAHFDLPENLACVVAGRRRFTLFPPAQVHNLYIGPLDFTPAGQPISLVDFYQPDFERYPRYAEALAAASVAELNPGDVLYVPSMWWHQVEGLDRFNALINFWWRSTPTWTGLPLDAMVHALLSIGSLPKAQRQAWGELFQHFVVNRDEATRHIPVHRHGLLADLGPQDGQQIRQLLNKKLQQ